MSQYQTIKTQAGMALEAAADTGGASIKLATMSVGDGNGQPVSVSTTQTGLVHEVDRVSLNRLQQNPNDATQWVAEAVFPADRGGYTVREVGLWTESGVLFAVSNFPDTYKPAPEQGTAGQLIIQLNFRAANSDNVTLVVDGSLQLATLEQLNTESQRAQNAENNLLSGVMGVSSKDGDFRGLGWIWQGASQAPCFIFLGPDGKPVFKAVVTREQVDAWLANLASNAALNAETIRATNAENARVAKAGDTMGGSLIFDSGSPFTAWSASPQLIYRIGGGVVSLWGQVFGDRIVLLLGGNNPGQPYRNWRFDPTAGTLTSPSGNTIPEVVGFGDARVCDQAFIVRGVSQGGPDSETWVTFPVQFAAGSKPVVTLTVNRETNRTSRGVSLGNINNQNETNVTNTGFSFQPWFAIGGNINTSGQPWEIHVRVIGVM